MFETSGFLELFLLLSYKTVLCSRKKCVASLWLVVIYICGVIVVDFANRLFCVLAHVLGRGGCDGWSQIDLCSEASTENLINPSCTPCQKNRVFPKKLGFCPFFIFANYPPFSAENRFAKRSQDIGAESTKFALNAFPALWGRGWHLLSNNQA